MYLGQSVSYHNTSLQSHTRNTMCLTLMGRPGCRGSEWARRGLACVPEGKRGGGQSGGHLSADLRGGVVGSDVGGLALLLCPLEVLLRRSKVPKVCLHHPEHLIIS